MEENPVLVLFDPGRHFEEGEDQRRGLGLGQRCMLQGMCAQGMMQDIGRTRKEQPQRVGQEGGRGGAVAVEVTLHRLDGIFTVAPGTVESSYTIGGVGAVEGGDDKAGVVTSAHDFGLEHHAPRLGPGRRAIEELLIQAAAGGGPGAVGLREGRPLLVETACFLHDGDCVAEQDGIPGQAKDEIGQAPGAITSMTSGVAKWLSPRTRIWVRGQW